MYGNGNLGGVNNGFKDEDEYYDSSSHYYQEKAFRVYKSQMALNMNRVESNSSLSNGKFHQPAQFTNLNQRLMENFKNSDAC